jgi:hypothetical protein
MGSLRTLFSQKEKLLGDNSQSGVDCFASDISNNIVNYCSSFIHPRHISKYTTEYFIRNRLLKSEDIIYFQKSSPSVWKICVRHKQSRVACIWTFVWGEVYTLDKVFYQGRDIIWEA